jgi:hypothetical protein
MAGVELAGESARARPKHGISARGARRTTSAEEGTSMKASEIFKAGWMMFGLPDLRPSSHTYEQTDYNSLPRVPRIDPHLAWLTPLHPKIDKEMRVHRPDEEGLQTYMKKRERIIAEARALKLALPETFVQLTGSFELQDRIPSCTACYFDLPEKVIESPFRDGDHLIRFLNDQQVCVCWYLYLPADELPFVISSSGDGEEPFLDTTDFAKRADSLAVARKYSALAAKSFDEFIYRFWIENCIWFHLDMGLPLTPCQLEYVRSIDPSYRDPNAS